MAVAIEPGPIYVGSPVTIYATFSAVSGDEVVVDDPDTVSAKLMSPSGTTVTKVHGVDAPVVTDTLQIGRSSTGLYYIIITPDAGGRWHYRISSTGSAASIEGDILVQRSPFVDSLGPEAYRR